MIERDLKNSFSVLPVAAVMAAIALLLLLFVGVPEVLCFLVAGVIGGCYIGVKIAYLVQ